MLHLEKDTDQQKRQIVENLYLTFRKYTTSDMHYCDCGCIDINDVRKLASKPLRLLEEDDFCSYHLSAMYTWGEVEHYKHFLPRILEVYNINGGDGMIDLYDIIAKLRYAEWNRWDSNEISVIKSFILMDWTEKMNNSVFEISIDTFINYSFFIDIPELCANWYLTQSSIALKNFVNFFYYHGNTLMNSESKKMGMFYSDLLNQLTQSEELIGTLEDTFFKITDIEYSTKISAVTQMLEQLQALHNK